MERTLDLQAKRLAISREALFCTALAATLATLVAWLGPTGTDFAAHAYQRALFIRHGFTLWDNFWYAGSYSFADYSLLYYPLAAWVGIRILAVAAVSVGVLAFTVVSGREWGSRARWASRSFAVVWAGFLISAGFPFALGFAFALLALWALQTGHRWRFAALTLLTLAASPLALVLLIVVVAAVALSRRTATRNAAIPALALIAAGVAELVLLRLFPGTGRYPFPTTEAAMALGFCALGVAAAWRVESARIPRYFLAAWAVAIALAYLVPSGLGENITRLRYAALPLAVLIVALRRWRPAPLAAAVVCAAFAWNATPLAASLLHAESDATVRAAVWRAPLAYLHAHLRPGYRVEAVDTAEHWPAFYLAESGIPLLRGWFRQDDFPLDALLYRHFTPAAYRSWLRELGAAYVVLTRSPPDYSSQREARLVRSGRAGLHRVWTSGEVAIYAVPRPRPILTGPGKPELLTFGNSRLLVRLTRGGTYRLAVRWSPYWQASTGCLAPSRDGMLRLRTRGAATVRIAFDVDAHTLLSTLAGAAPTRCRRP